MGYSGFDGPYFSILSQLYALLPVFIGYAWGLARVLIILALCLAGLKNAVNGDGLKDSVSKLAIAFIVLQILIGGKGESNYSKLMSGMQSMIATMSKNAIYDQGTMQSVLDSKQAEINGLKEKLAQAEADAAKLTIGDFFKMGNTDAVRAWRLREQIQKAEENGLTLVDTNLYEGGIISPNKFIRILGATVGEIIGYDGFWEDPFKKILSFIAGLVVILCGTFGGLQYFICVLEFALITSVGVFLLPFMLWDGTKFITEKLFGALLGFFLKMLFCNLTLLLMIYGFLGLTAPDKPFDGTTEYCIYIIFMSIFYMMLCQSGPQLAISLLTGTPQMSLMEGAKAVGAFAGAGVAAAKGLQMAGKTVAPAAVGTVGAGVKALAAGVAGGGIGGAAMSLAGSAASGIKNAVSHTASSGIKSLMSGGKSGGANSGGGSSHYHPNSIAGGVMQNGFGATFSGLKQSGTAQGTAYKEKSALRQAQHQEKVDQKNFNSAYKKSGDIKSSSDENKAHDF